jgi:hypothetical protein
VEKKQLDFSPLHRKKRFATSPQGTGMSLTLFYGVDDADNASSGQPGAEFLNF